MGEHLVIWSRVALGPCSGRGGVSGLANVDATPELAAKVALAFATFAAEGHHRRGLARLESVGADAQAGDDGGPERGRHLGSWTSSSPACT